MPSRRIVDASPLILLAKIGRLELLRLGRLDVVVPEVVLDEVRAKGTSDPMAEAIVRADWLTYAPRSPVPPAVAACRLHPGESAVLGLALGDPESHVVLDDRAGRACARRLGVACVGTLGLILLARKEGVVPAARPLVEQLFRAGGYLDERFAAEALRRLGE